MSWDAFDRLLANTIDGMFYVFGSDDLYEAWQQRKKRERHKALQKQRQELTRELGRLLRNLGKTGNDGLSLHEAYVLRRIKSEYPYFDYNWNGEHLLVIISPLVFLVHDESKTSYFGLLVDNVHDLSPEEAKNRGWESLPSGCYDDEGFYMSDYSIRQNIIRSFEGKKDLEWFVPYADEALGLAAQVDFLQTLLNRFESLARKLRRGDIYDGSQTEKLQSASRNLFDACPVNHDAFRRHFLVSCSSCDGVVPRKKTKRGFYCICPFCDSELACYGSEEGAASSTLLLPDRTDEDMQLLASIDVLAGDTIDDY